MAKTEAEDFTGISEVDNEWTSHYASFCLARLLIRNNNEVRGQQMLEELLFLLHTKIPNVDSESLRSKVHPSIQSGAHITLLHLLPDVVALLADTIARSRVSDGVANDLVESNSNPSVNSFSSTMTPTSPAVAPSGNSRSSTPVSRVQSSLDRARQLYEEAYMLYRLVYGNDSLRSGEMQTALGDLCRVQKRCDLALLFSLLFSLDVILRLVVYRVEDAKNYYEAALLVFKGRYDGPHQRTGFAMVGLAETLMREQRREGISRRLLEEALMVFRGMYPDDHICVRTTAASLATLLTIQMR